MIYFIIKERAEKLPSEMQSPLFGYWKAIFVHSFQLSHLVGDGLGGVVVEWGGEKMRATNGKITSKAPKSKE